MLILFVGDKPSPRMKPGAPAFQGAACEKRLKEWIEFLGVREYILVNRVDSNFGEVLAEAMNKGCRIIALGNKASRTFDRIEHFKLPHPSGRNRQINDALFVKMKLSEAKDWLRSRQK
jgi:hypothetical protein